jgi:hypothetical protein
MEFDTLIRESWSATWRYRSLWLLGLLAGGAGGGGSCSFRSSGSLPGGSFPTEVQPAFDQVGGWVAANLTWLILCFVVLALVGLALFAAGFIAQGGMAGASVALARGQQTSLRAAWRAGLRLGWRYVGLWLLLLLVGLVGIVVTLLIVGVVAGIGFLAARTGGGGIALAVGLAIVVGIPLVLLLIAGTIALSIVFIYAQRLIATEDAGPAEALGLGWRLLRGRTGPSTLVWLVSFGLGIGAAIAGFVVLLPILALFGGAGYVAYTGSGLGAPLVVITALGVLTLLAAGILLAAITNTFFWHYWTRAYLRLRPPPAPA